MFLLCGKVLSYVHSNDKIFSIKRDAAYSSRLAISLCPIGPFINFCQSSSALDLFLPLAFKPPKKGNLVLHTFPVQSLEIILTQYMFSN